MTDTKLQNIFAQLEDHEKRIRVLEGSEVKNLPKRKPAHSSKKQTRNKGDDLYPPIQKLHEGSFFNDAKIDLDVVSELQKKLLTRKKPLRASVVNVLRKMVRDGSLERIGVTRSEKTAIAYIKP
jgi:hypothetical protein